MVDYEYCLKVSEKGYKILFLKEIYIRHSLGEIFKRKNILTKKIKEKIEHSPLRVYYKTRNSLYLVKKYPKIGILKTLNINFIHEVLKIILYEDKKLKKLFAKVVALYHYFIGYKGRLKNIKL
jgi:rhamnosyltransferase